MNKGEHEDDDRSCHDPRDDAREGAGARFSRHSQVPGLRAPAGLARRHSHAVLCRDDCGHTGPRLRLSALSLRSERGARLEGAVALRRFPDLSGDPALGTTEVRGVAGADGSEQRGDAVGVLGPPAVSRTCCAACDVASGGTTSKVRPARAVGEDDVDARATCGVFSAVPTLRCGRRRVDLRERAATDPIAAPQPYRRGGSRPVFSLRGTVGPVEIFPGTGTRRTRSA